jgi:hypothetical protein
MPNAESGDNVCVIAHVWRPLTSIVGTAHRNRVAGVQLSREKSLIYIVKVPTMLPALMNCAAPQWLDSAASHFVGESLKIVEVTYVTANGATPREETCCTQPAAGPREPWRRKRRCLSHNWASAPTHRKPLPSYHGKNLSQLRYTQPRIAPKPNSPGRQLRREQLPYVRAHAWNLVFLTLIAGVIDNIGGLRV